MELVTWGELLQILQESTESIANLSLFHGEIAPVGERDETLGSIIFILNNVYYQYDSLRDMLEDSSSIGGEDGEKEKERG